MTLFTLFSERKIFKNYMRILKNNALILKLRKFLRVNLANSQTQKLPSFSPSNFEKFRGLPSPILDSSCCPRSRKPSKFENENENFRGLRSRLASLVCTTYGSSHFLGPQSFTTGRLTDLELQCTAPHWNYLNILS